MKRLDPVTANEIRTRDYLLDLRMCAGAESGVWLLIFPVYSVGRGP